MTNPLKTRAARNLLCASAAIVALHACATAPKVMTAGDLLAAPYALKGGAPFDVDAMFAALPDWILVSHDGAYFDADLGGMAIDGLTIALASAPDARLVAERTVMWGGDPAAAEAVFSGAASFTDMSALFDRLSIEGLHSEGLQWETGTENASLSIGKLVIDGLSARSYALAEKEGAAEAAFLRHAAAVMGSFAYDGAAYSGFSFRLNNSNGDNVEMKVDEAFARGYRAGAVAYQSARGIYAVIDGADSAPLVEVAGEKQEGARAKSPYEKILNKPPAETASDMIRHPAAFLAEATGGLATEYRIDFTETRNADVSGGLSWLARWELPPIAETELLDFGAQTLLGYSEIWNGAPVYTVDRVEVSSADFYWLVPSRYDAAYSGATYDFNVMFAQMRDGMGAGFSTEAAPQFEEIFKLLNGLGIERMTADMGMSWRWNGETGDAGLTMTGDAADLGAFVFGTSAGGPSLARWDEMARNDTPAVQAASEITLKSLRHSLIDKGVVDRAFAYAAAENGAGTGPELRQSVAAMVRLSGMQAGEANARFPAYAAAVADFLERGGAITLLAAPAAPVSILNLQTVSQTAPQTLPDVLNITVTHTD